MNAPAPTSSRRLTRCCAFLPGLIALPCAAAASFDSAIAIDDGRAMLEAGDTTQYTVLVTNSGPDAVTQATVHVSVSGYVVQATWTCETDTGAPCAVATGIGPPVQLIDIPANHSLIYHLSVTTKSNASGSLTVFGTLRAHGDQLELDDADNTDIDVDHFGVFADGFEAP